MTPVKITDENFALAMDQIKTAHFMLGMFDWQALLDQRAHADSIMHITDPTGYRDLINSTNAADNFKAAHAAAAFLRSLNALTPSQRNQP